MTTSTLENKSGTRTYTPLFSSEDTCGCEEDLEVTKTDNSLMDFYSLHQQTFFSYGSCATLEDWNSFVDSDRKLSRIRRALLRKL